ncbi:type III pantothenate kinase [Acinetobacter pollinis]|uniref:type III pantothenate kinase n=1 Tax=Acinetobacter pollinis TaxID=2605270 RepID=UPI0018A2A9AC|nr:type III pantothenate kinase [Acinetobacter pollinis]MBF7689259.1 type III pantothenate kinase [Acinetobacter pollinis]MBF7691922.1 type III pantothenate kinase [Acinetobacter pollinis]MBF7696804.1 type III pantothenate kinase [Acinetobacter pollinis]MBF7700027.1 type III pantothenate kinase [Acinetobacter pollinis]
MRCLWLDIGNTRLKYWITENGKTLEHFAELHLQSPADVLIGLIQYFKRQNFNCIGISSVLDQRNNQHIERTLQHLKCPMHFVQVHQQYKKFICGYEDVSQLGIDRWLQMLAIAEPNKNYCIVGCGTALTIDLVEGMQHLGGYILPNLYLQRDALIQNTKGIKIPDSAFSILAPGHNTVDCVHHGILLGLVSSIEKIMQQDQTKQLVLTGGDAPLFANHLSTYNPQVVPDLLLKGLQTYIDY